MAQTLWIGRLQLSRKLLAIGSFLSQSCEQGGALQSKQTLYTLQSRRETELLVDRSLSSSPVIILNMVTLIFRIVTPTNCTRHLG